MITTETKLLIGVILISVLAGAAIAGVIVKASSSRATASTSGETYDQMMARMHPGGADSMAGHHGGTPTTAYAGPANAGMQQLSFGSAVGQPAPDFSLINQDGTVTKLSDYRGKTVVLFFNEGAMCYPACWSQISSLANDPRFNTDDVVAISIETDTKEQWDKIIASQPKLKSATILFDTNRAVSTAYDVLNLPSSMHKGSLPGHTYVVIGPDGRISYVLDDENMAINNDLLATKV